MEFSKATFFTQVLTFTLSIRIYAIAFFKLFKMFSTKWSILLCDAFYIATPIGMNGAAPIVVVPTAETSSSAGTTRSL